MKPSDRMVLFFIMKRDSNKEGERQSLSEENSPVDCFCRRGNEHSEAREATASEKFIAFCQKYHPDGRLN